MTAKLRVLIAALVIAAGGLVGWTVVAMAKPLDSRLLDGQAATAAALVSVFEVLPIALLAGIVLVLFRAVERELNGGGR